MELGDLFATMTIAGAFVIALFIKIWLLKDFAISRRFVLAGLSSAITAILLVAIIYLLLQVEEMNAWVLCGATVIIPALIDGILLSTLVDRGLPTVNSLEKYVVFSLIAYLAALFLTYAGGIILWIVVSIWSTFR